MEAFLTHLLNKLLFNYKHHSGFFEINIFFICNGGKACFLNFVYLSACLTAADFMDILSVSVEGDCEIIVFIDKNDPIIQNTDLLFYRFFL